MLHFCDQTTQGIAMRYAAGIAISFLVAGTLVAADLGRAVGSVTIDGKPIVLQYAYAIDHQKNQLSNKSNETKVILTDKPIPDGTKLDAVDYNFPAGINGVVVSVAPNDSI